MTVLLGGYAAKRCPVRTQNDFDPTVPTLIRIPTPEEQARLDAGRAFESRMFDHLAQLHGQRTFVVTEETGAGRVRETLAAMQLGHDLILGGQLPDDAAGGRTGKPDILVRVTTDSNDRTYLPAEVKHHSTFSTAKRVSALMSGTVHPAIPLHVPGVTTAGSHRAEDTMQLSHYTRMLQACGFHPGDDWLYGLVMGTSVWDLDGAGAAQVFVWHSLTEPMFPTYSRSQGKTIRTALQRYDHEHDFRLMVARSASGAESSALQSRPVPIGQAECGSCPYEAWCDHLMGDDDASRHIVVGRLGVREWRALRRIGIHTVPQLASLDPNDETFQDQYLPEVTHLTRPQALKRLETAVGRAQMVRDGVQLQRKSADLLAIPTADTEVDVDVEWDTNNRVYLWGARLRRGQAEESAEYHPEFTTFDTLDQDAERRLAEKFAAWLRGLIATEAAAGRNVSVFHWSHPEVSQLRRVLGSSSVEDLVGDDGVYIDLRRFVEAEFTAVSGSSLKRVARNLGFSWRVEDAGGSESQTYLEKARDPEHPMSDAARRWLFTYNEDDCAATAAIRDALRNRYGAVP